jgi:hypothetical protein
MLTSGQVKAKYGISKSQLDVLASRFKAAWKIKKAGGKFIWHDEAISLLLAYLGKPATDQTTDTPPSLPILSAPSAPTTDYEKNTMDMARAIGEKLDSMQADYKNALLNQAKDYQAEIEKLKNELKREIAEIKKTLPPAHGERRHPPEGFFDLIYRYFCLSPAIERRR